MASLIELLEQSILFEGRAEEVLKKYQGKITPETLNKFVEAQNQMDPKLNNKYLDWMTNQFVKGEDTDKIINAVSTWHKNLPKLTPANTARIVNDALSNYGRAEKDQEAITKMPKDINVYSSLTNLIDVGNELANEKSKTEKSKHEEDVASKTSRTIYEDNHYKIIVPLSHAASCKYGKGTKWCLSMNNTDSHWTSMVGSHIVYFVIDKYEEERPDHPAFKVAVLVDRNSDAVQIWNSRDAQMSVSTSHDPDKNRNIIAQFFPMELATAILNYKKKYVIDLTKTSKQVTQMLANQNGDFAGWELTKGQTGFPTLVSGEYLVIMDVNLKHKNIACQLKISNQEKKLADGSITIPEGDVKEIEDIIIEHESDPGLLSAWIRNLIFTLKKEFPIALRQFQPVMSAIETYKVVAKKINKYTGGWQFKIENIPSDVNKKLVAKSVRIIRDEKAKEDLTYTLLATLDFNRNMFILGAEEMKSNGQKEDYGDTEYPFDKDLVKNPATLSVTFLDWLKEILANIYDEDWQQWETTTDPKILKGIAGHYTSKTAGNFTVEIDSDNMIHVTSDKTGGHYLIHNHKAFEEKIVKPYGLKKIK
jgi:hypothetical protein